jgi:hypothetical protein
MKCRCIRCIISIFTDCKAAAVPSIFKLITGCNPPIPVMETLRIRIIDIKLIRYIRIGVLIDDAKAYHVDLATSNGQKWT